jgi:protein phosphatase
MSNHITSDSALPTTRLHGDESVRTIKVRRQSSPEQSQSDAGADAGPTIDAAGATDVGCVRERNEDQFLVAELDRWLLIRDTSLDVESYASHVGGRQGWLLAVADGIGGRAGGDFASSTALSSLIHYVTSTMPWLVQMDEDAREGLTSEIEHMLEHCQARIERIARRRGLGDSLPGTTLTLAYIIWPYLHVMHVGDSRCYLVRDGKIEPLTHDHTVAQRLVEHAVMSPEELADSPFKNVLDNAIAGGMQPPRIEVQSRRLALGDQVLLCTDGLTDDLDTSDIHRILATEGSAASCCRRLIELAREAGGHDNITAVVARFHD